MDKVIGVQEAVSKISDGDVVMVGGFLAVGGPNKIIDYIVENTDLKELTLICNDTAFIDKGVGKMVEKKQFKKIIASHIGTNRETGRQMNEGETEVQLVPQGTLAERVRAAGYGLGGILTKTGIGIKEIEEGKQKITVQGEEYLLEEPLKADVAIINARYADKFGNLKFEGSTVNFNNIMAFAADTVIVEADEVVEIGELDPNDVVTPGILVDFIVDGGAL
ncbi:MAG: CoA transferase subunit A [Tissierellia bacterium]|nr:CoA transferase subunit A [Tissierellia bacterium]